MFMLNKISESESESVWRPFLQSKFWCKFQSLIWIEGILNKIYRAQHRDKY